MSSDGSVRRAQSECLQEEQKNQMAAYSFQSTGFYGEEPLFSDPACSFFMETCPTAVSGFSLFMDAAVT